MQTRDQQRALHAYGCVEKVDTKERNDYKVQVNSFGANILRSGLAAAVSFLERDKDKALLFLGHLRTAHIPGIDLNSKDSFPEQIRNLKLDAYMLATRETLKVALWFRRAVQAQSWGKDEYDANGAA